MGPLGEGSVVVDIGCGAGMDLLLAARSVGPRGRAIGIDMTEAMAGRARASARAARLENVEVRLGDAMALPLEDASVDVVISNGVLNLTPDKTVSFGEVHRVLRPGGRFLYADISIGNELSESTRRDIDLWTG
jgi:ubiquinone/menaquinone biosynthesis C-methylase UbiE